MSLNKKSSSFFFINVVVFICGAVLMSLEISGSRVLTPYFGNTIFVWASLISILLAALACGYYLGGKLADKIPSFTLWGATVGLAGIFTLIIPFLSGPICRTIVNFETEDRIGSLLASCFIFFLPSILLGMVSPFAIKFSLKNISVAGDIAGKLYAVSAVGNIFGTLFTAFYLISKLKVSEIFNVLGLTLIFTSVVILVSGRRMLNFTVSIILAAISLVLTMLHPPGLIATSEDEVIRLQKDSFYHHIMVVDNLKQKIRELRFDKLSQTAIRLAGSHESAYNYSDMLHIPLVFCPRMRNVLFIGGGGAVVPRNYYFDYRGINVDMVEIDPAVVQISKDYFFFKPYNNLRPIIDDGRRFVQKTKRKYDVVIIDAFNARGDVPFHLLTKEFFGELETKMSPGGTLAINLICSVTGRRSGLFLAIYKTLAAAFNNVYVFPNVLYDPLKDYTQRRNVIIVATKTGIRLSPQKLYQKMDKLVKSGRVKISNFAEYARYSLEINPSELKDAILLTDEYAPVEYLAQSRILP
ncbi:MAG: fused MFS/spermidine synthase [Deltaproteobacteria bacterium]|nr:fused MFS/spermidine synthase [Deltaproteobacteria bacterium]